VPEKNLFRLLEAYARYCEQADDPWSLVMCGDGPLGPSLKQFVAERRLPRVVWPGFVQIDRLPAFYALARAFILPSVKEPWGLVVNEAMACGLPVLVSRQCGCAADLVAPGRNGYVYDAADADALYRLMTMVSGVTFKLAPMGEASREIIRRWSPDTFAESLWKAVGAVRGQSVAPLSPLMRGLLWALLRR